MHANTASVTLTTELPLPAERAAALARKPETLASHQRRGRRRDALRDHPRDQTDQPDTTSSDTATACCGVSACCTPGENAVDPATSRTEAKTVTRCACQ